MTQVPVVTDMLSHSLDLSIPQRLHVVGVGGPGMSAIAIVLAEMGHIVSGSDLRERPILDRLRAGGVTVHVGHHRSHIDGCRCGDVQHRRSPGEHRARRGPGHGCAHLPPGGHVGRHLCAGPVGGRRRHARQDHDIIDADADAGRRRSGARASSSVATSPTRARVRSGPVAIRRQPAGWSSRPTRVTAHISNCPCTGRS